MALSPCGSGYCGQITRPLDPTGHVPGTIPIAFELVPHTDSGAPAKETIVAQEGGPGLPSIGTRADYLRLFKTLRSDHDVLMVDPRGTGSSGLIKCGRLQHEQTQTVRAVGACGKQLGDTADLYGTGLAVEDMIAVLDALNIGSSPWYPSAGEIVRFGFNATCQRAPYCASLPGTPLQRIDELVKAVHRMPFSGTAPDENGTPTFATADPRTVGLILYGGLSGPVNYRDLDAAIRAKRDNGDTLPLLRLVAENVSGDGPSAAFPYSRGLFSAVSCMDYPEIYNMNQGFAERLRERDAALAEERVDDPGVYSPLTLDEFQTVSIDSSVLNYCLQWPISHPPYPVGQPIPPHDQFTNAPTLVINGELDMLTPSPDGAETAAQFPNGQQLIIANSFHVDALGDVDDCTQTIVRRFVATLSVGDTSCAASVKPVRLVPFFPLLAAKAIPAIPAAGNEADKHGLSLASAAVQTAGDAMARWYINYTGTGGGLRGGTWGYTQRGEIASFTLTGARWTTDLAVSGTMVWNQSNGAIQAQLQFAEDGGATGTINATWNDHESLVAAQLAGTVGGRTVAASMPAP
jgi:pimeloyl-ACP methyl ester carboxylesterase